MRGQHRLPHLTDAALLGLGQRLICCSGCAIFGCGPRLPVLRFFVAADPSSTSTPTPQLLGKGWQCPGQQAQADCFVVRQRLLDHVHRLGQLHLLLDCDLPPPAIFLRQLSGRRSLQRTRHLNPIPPTPLGRIQRLVHRVQRIPICPAASAPVGSGDRCGRSRSSTQGAHGRPGYGGATG